jgi:MFS family permease
LFAVLLCPREGKLGLAARAVGDALGTPALRRLQAAWAACSLGGWAFFVTLSIYAYDVGGASLVGVAAVVRMAPAALAAPATSLLGDRYPRRDVLLYLALARSLVLAVAAATVALDGPPALVFALAALFTAVGTGHKPAQAALLPALADEPRQLAAANALWSATDNGAFVGGALVGGALVAAASIEAAFVATGATFVFAAAALAAIPKDAVPAHRDPQETTPLRQLAEGARTVAREPSLRLVVGILTFATLVEGLIDVLVVVVAVQLVALGNAGVGWLNACWGVGGVLGGAVALMLLGARRLAAGLALGGVLVGAALEALGALPSAATAVAALTILGVGYALIEVAGMTLLQRFASDDVLARAFAVVESSYWVATGVGAIIAAPLVAWLGIRGALVAAGLALLVAVVARWAALARFEAGLPVPERDFDLLRRVPFFAPMPLATIESLARRLTVVEVSAGDAVIREGEPADRLYVVAAGRLQIVRQGVPCAAVSSGDFFGESALLRDCPRTASVTAVKDGTLLALARDDVLQTLTSHPRSADLADAIIDTRTRRDRVAAADHRA